MERERLAREAEEKQKADKEQKLKDTFADPNNQWEKDKAAIQDIAKSDKAKGAKALDSENNKAAKKDDATKDTSVNAKKADKNDDVDKPAKAKKESEAGKDAKAAKKQQ